MSELAAPSELSMLSYSTAAVGRRANLSIVTSVIFDEASGQERGIPERDANLCRPSGLQSRPLGDNRKVFHTTNSNTCEFLFD